VRIKDARQIQANRSVNESVHHSTSLLFSDRHKESLLPPAIIP